MVLDSFPFDQRCNLKQAGNKFSERIETKIKKGNDKTVHKQAF